MDLCLKGKISLRAMREAKAAQLAGKEARKDDISRRITEVCPFMYVSLQRLANHAENSAKHNATPWKLKSATWKVRGAKGMPPCAD